MREVPLYPVPSLSSDDVLQDAFYPIEQWLQRRPAAGSLWEVLEPLLLVRCGLLEPLLDPTLPTLVLASLAF